MRVAKTLTWVVGVVLTIVGIWGYLGGTPVLGIFEVDGLHNLIHLVSGVVAILAALGGEKYCKTYLQVFGVIYAVVFLFGIFTTGKILGLVASNTADDILHLIIAVVLLYGGFGKMKAMEMGIGGGAPATP